MDAPPPYDKIEGDDRSRLQVRNGITPQMRRSMEDEGRPLPEGWVRSYDPENDHQFFVDTTADPPRSIWQHPYDDENYLKTLAPKERDRVGALHRVPTDADIAAESSDDDTHEKASTSKQTASSSAGGARSANGPSDSMAPGSSDRDKRKLGRKLKDKLTGSTHEEREVQRQQRAQQEAAIYERHRQLRQAMLQAAQTGQPQWLGKDPRTGQDVYIEPPNGPQLPPGALGYNPYAQGPYANPNARFIRPDYPYGRPYGGGYGGGYGLPLAGGLFGGLLLGSLLF